MVLRIREREEKLMRKRIVTLMLAGMMALSMTACGERADSKTTDTKQESREQEKVYIQENEITDLFANPNKYKGKYVKLSGKIFNKPENDGKNIAYQTWHDISSSDKDFIFFLDNDDSLNADDYVMVDGKITGSFTGENAFGTKMECPEIEAVNVEKLSYIDAVVPTIKEIAPENAISEQNGISLKVDKVEFAEKETRIYLTETNSSADKFSMWVYSIKLVQNGQQIEQDMTSSSSYEGNYTELASDILPNASSSGVLVFPAMDSSVGFQVYAEGSSDNWELDFAPFTIDIATQ